MPSLPHLPLLEKGAAWEEPAGLVCMEVAGTASFSQRGEATLDPDFEAPVVEMWGELHTDEKGERIEATTTRE